MGIFTFKWTQPAEEVYVTGTFDGWTKSVQLEKVGNAFVKTVELPEESDKIFYKFVVDHNWVTDPSALREKDEDGNLNNVLLAESIQRINYPSPAKMTGVTPDSTTAALAAAAPLEKKVDEAVAKAADVKEKAVEAVKENAADKVASDVKASDEAATTAKDEVKEVADAVPPPTEVTVNPLPAADDALNPIKLAPGEPVPDHIASDDTNKHVKLDKDSYEKADTLPGSVSAAAATLAPVSDKMIPESSLPLSTDGVHISTVTPAATTAQLAADAPIETKKEEAAPVETKKEAAPVEATKEVPAPVEAKKEEHIPTMTEAVAGIKAAAGAKVGKVTSLVAGATAAAVAAKDSVVKKATDVVTHAKETPAAAPEASKEAAPVAPAEAKETPEAATEATTKTEVDAPAEPKAEATATAEPNAEATAPAEPKAEATAPAEPKAEEVPAAKTAEEVAPAAKATEASPANGEVAAETAGPSSTVASETPAAKKKKNRLSMLFSRFRSKAASKN